MFSSPLPPSEWLDVNSFGACRNILEKEAVQYSQKSLLPILCIIDNTMNKPRQKQFRKCAKKSCMNEEVCLNAQYSTIKSQSDPEKSKILAQTTFCLRKE